MLISIDHGNKQIKTNHRTFVSGLRESDTKPPFGKDVLFYKGKYYTLTDQRIPYMRDKTADEGILSSRCLPLPLSLPEPTTARMRSWMCSLR